MSANYYRQQIQQAQQQIATYQHEKARETTKVADLARKINSVGQSTNRYMSASTLASKGRETARYRTEEANAHKRIASLEDKIAQAQKKQRDAQKSLEREEDREARRRHEEVARQVREQEAQMRRVTGTLTQHDAMYRQTRSALERLSRLPERIVVLFLASNPIDQQQLRLDEEARSIAEMIRRSEHRDAVKLESRWAVRPLDVLQAINEHKPCVVHFSGHGSDQGEIVFQDEAGNTKFVTLDAIVQTMAAASENIRLVFFNSCNSRPQAEAVVQHVEASIGMKDPIGDDAARVFAAQFYSAIGFGRSVQQAFQQARAALMLEGIREEDTPELFVAPGMTGEEIVLVRPALSPAQSGV